MGYSIACLGLLPYSLLPNEKQKYTKSIFAVNTYRSITLTISHSQTNCLSNIAIEIMVSAYPYKT